MFGSTVACDGDAFAMAIICLNFARTSESGLTVNDSVGLEQEGEGVGASDIRISQWREIVGRGEIRFEVARGWGTISSRRVFNGWVQNH